jgi:5-methylcytosine-specific restriction endonuclease McrA
MPMKRENYPDNWDEIRLQAYERAEWRCEHCNAEFIPGTTKARYARNRDGSPLILTVHHLSGNTHDNSWENLLTCCQRCHLSIQGRWSPGDVLPISWLNIPPLWLERRKLPFQYHPQLPLFEEGLST